MSNEVKVEEVKIPEAFIENEDGTVTPVEDEFGKGEVGDLDKYGAKYTAPMRINTFDAIEITDEVIEHIKKSTDKRGDSVAYITYKSDTIKQEIVVYDDGSVYLCSNANEVDPDGEYRAESSVSVKLHKGDYIVRHAGLYNKVDNVILYTEEMNRLGELLKVR